MKDHFSKAGSESYPSDADLLLSTFTQMELSTGLCAFTNPNNPQSFEDHQNHCWKNVLNDFIHQAQNAKTDEFLDRVEIFHLQDLKDSLRFHQGKLISTRQDPYSLTIYLQKKNSLKQQRNASADPRIQQLTADLYHREIQNMGKLPILDYITVTYSLVQIHTMGDWIMEASHMFAAHQGFIEFDTPAQPMKIQLAPSDLYRFTVNYLHQEIREATHSPRGALYQAPPPKLADLVMAGYLCGKIQAEVLEAILLLPEMKPSTQEEQVKTFWDSAASFTIVLGRTLVPLVPVYGSYLNLGFLIYDSIQSEKLYEEKKLNEGYLIR